jgi:hypothetical protein
VEVGGLLDAEATGVGCADVLLDKTCVALAAVLLVWFEHVWFEQVAALVLLAHVVARVLLLARVLFEQDLTVERVPSHFRHLHF